jgi:cellulose biosynthesis protein BcsQ
MAQILTFTNAKGGCGKTTVALNLAICFARAGTVPLQ